MKFNEKKLFELAEELFPICRSLTGRGVRLTLKKIKQIIPKIQIKSTVSGTKVYDWKIPKEWSISEAFIEDQNKKRIIDFKTNNLHVVGYSKPINKILSLTELKKNIHTLPRQPNAIPYVTSYYRETWGFCMSHNQYKNLKPGNYRVVINSSLKKGKLNYGEALISGKSKKEILLTTYFCHPSLANDNVSGIVLLTAIAKWLLNTKRNYSYRILFIPETIGSIQYIHKNLKKLKQNVIAGYVITCVGDDGKFSFIPSREGNTLADKFAIRSLQSTKQNFKRYSFLQRGSDERQFCSVGVNLPVCSITKSKYAEFKEYHTSLDNLDYISQKGLTSSLNLYKKLIMNFEKSEFYMATKICEPHLSKYSLYPSTSTKHSGLTVRKMMNVLAYSDGKRDIEEISKTTKIPLNEVKKFIKILKNKKLIRAL